MSKLIFWNGLLLFVAALAAFAPNALWLSRSSMVIENAGERSHEVRLLLADNPDRLIEIGAIDRGARHFQWITPVGEAILEVDVHDGDVWRRHCSVYVEDSLYRVAVTVHSPRDVTCKANLPLLTHMLLVDYYSAR